jgi:hypothetical protein
VRAKGDVARTPYSRRKNREQGWAPGCLCNAAAVPRLQYVLGCREQLDPRLTARYRPEDGAFYVGRAEKSKRRL